jgi:hypothetical protein
MPWESRRGRGAYYTRSRKVNGQVVREYVGGGFAGQYAALRDEQERQARAAEREQLRAMQRADAEADAALAALIDATTTLARATLILAGYHRHKGEWRRRRG